MNHATLALEAHRENRISDALMHYTHALREHPASSETWVALGMLHHQKTGDYNQAIICYENSLALSAENPLAALQLGTLFAERDQQEKAIVYLKKHIEWESNAGTEAYTELACSYIRLGNMAEAQEVADLCRMKHPDDFFAPFLAAWIAAKRGHLADALCQITDSVSLDPLWPIPLGLRGLILSQAGEFEAARRVLHEMVAINGGVYASSLAPEERLNANRLWRNVRQDAKYRLGLRPSEPAHFIGLYGGLGDQFLTAIYLSAFKAFNNNVPLIVLSTARAQWERLFPDSADLFFHIEKDELHQLLACNRFFPDHPYTPFFPWFGHFGHLVVGHQYQKFYLGLPQTVRGTKPHITRETRLASLQRFYSLGGVAGRSVLLSPCSNSNPMVPGKWWQELVAEMKRAGFVIFQNTANMGADDPKELISSTIPVDLPIEQVIPFCEEAGFFVGVRSGLCDLLGYAELRMKCIHVMRRYHKTGRYPLALWPDTSHGMREFFENENWHDVFLDGQEEFDPSLFADWVLEPKKIHEIQSANHPEFCV